MFYFFCFFVIGCSNLFLQQSLKVGSANFNKLVAKVNAECDCYYSYKGGQVCDACRCLMKWSKKDILCKSEGNKNKIMRLLESELVSHQNVIASCLKNILKSLNKSNISMFDTPDINGNKTVHYFISKSYYKEMKDFLGIKDKDAPGAVATSGAVAISSDVNDFFGLSSFSLSGVAAKSFLALYLTAPDEISEYLKYDKSFLSSPIDVDGNYMDHILAMRALPEMCAAILKANIEYLLSDSKDLSEAYFRSLSCGEKIKIFLKKNNLGWDMFSISIKYFFNDNVSSILKLIKEKIYSVHKHQNDFKEIKSYLREMLLFAASVNNEEAVHKIFNSCPDMVEYNGEPIKTWESIKIFLSGKIARIVAGAADLGLEVLAGSVPFGSFALEGANMLTREITGRDKDGIFTNCVSAIRQSLKPITTDIFGFKENEIDNFDSRLDLYIIKKIDIYKERLGERYREKLDNFKKNFDYLKGYKINLSATFEALKHAVPKGKQSFFNFKDNELSLGGVFSGFKFQSYKIVHIDETGIKLLFKNILEKTKEYQKDLEKFEQKLSEQNLTELFKIHNDLNLSKAEITQNFEKLQKHLKP